MASDVTDDIRCFLCYWGGDFCQESGWVHCSTAATALCLPCSSCSGGLSGAYNRVLEDYLERLIACSSGSFILPCVLARFPVYIHHYNQAVKCFLFWTVYTFLPIITYYYVFFLLNIVFTLELPMSLRIGQGILDSQPCSSDSHVIRFVPDLSHYMLNIRRQGKKEKWK